MVRKQKLLHLVTLCLLVLSCFFRGTDGEEDNTEKALNQTLASLYLSADCESILELNIKKEEPFNQQCAIIGGLKTVLASNGCDQAGLNTLQSIVCGTFTVPTQYSTHTDLTLVTNDTGITNNTTPNTLQTNVTLAATAQSKTLTTTTVSPEKEILAEKQNALDYINKNVNSEACKQLASAAAAGLSTLEEACKLTETQKELLLSKCSEADIAVIMTAVCVNYTMVNPDTTSAPDKDADAHREKVLCVIDTQLSSKTCKATARGQAEGKSDRVAACNTLKSFEHVLASFECTIDDYNKLYEVICDDKDVPCTPLGPVDEVVRSLTSRCKSTINIELNHLKSPKGCSILKSSKDQLLDNLICTPGDIEKLNHIVCNNENNATADGSITAGGRMDEAVDTIRTKISNRCRDVIGYELEIEISLDALCLKLKSAGPTLVTRGSCTQDDYDILEPVVCVVPRVYDPEEQLQRDEIHKVIIELSSECKKTMLDQEKQMQESTVDMACQKLTASHDVLITTQICDEAEIRKLNSVICNGAPGKISNFWTLSLLILLANMLI